MRLSTSCTLYFCGLLVMLRRRTCRCMQVQDRRQGQGQMQHHQYHRCLVPNRQVDIPDRIVIKHGLQASCVLLPETAGRKLLPCLLSILMQVCMHAHACRDSLWHLHAGDAASPDANHHVQLPADSNHITQSVSRISRESRLAASHPQYALGRPAYTIKKVLSDKML